LFIFFSSFRWQKEVGDGRWWKFTPFESNSAFVQVMICFIILRELCNMVLTPWQRWDIFMLLPLSYEMWAFPYRLALGVPAIR
jgi:hypothetical protein